MPRRNYRSRIGGSDDEESQLVHESSSEMTVKPKNKPTTLSFGDDLEPDDEISFKPKKSNTVAENRIIQARELRKKRKEEKKVHLMTNDAAAAKEPEIMDISVKKMDSTVDSNYLNEIIKQESSEEEQEVQVTQFPKNLSNTIPDAATIHMARKQRERAKNQTEEQAAESVPVEESRSRLHREEDAFSEEDDFHQYPSFVSNLNRQTKMHKVGVSSTFRKAKPLTEQELKSYRQEFLEVEHGSDRDSEQENEWENQQIQKAISHGPDPEVKEILLNMEQRQKKPLLDADHPPLDPSDATIDQIKFLLKKRHQNLTKSFAENQEKIELYKSQIKGGADLRRILAVWSNRCQRLMSRRRQDLKDLCEEVSASINGSVVESISSAEFVRRKADREARCKRRRSQRPSLEATVVGVDLDEAAEGLSTDDEETAAEMLKRQSDIDGYLETSKLVFEDVVDEFHSLPMILQIFSDWREAHPKTFEQAHISLCISQLVLPLVRHQMISWDPLHMDSDVDEFERMEWFKSVLSFYLATSDEQDLESASDQCKVVTSLIENVLLEKISRIAQVAWDPTSAKETITLINCLNSLYKQWPLIFNAQNASFRNCMSQITKRLEHCVKEDLYIPLYPHSLVVP
ncbi:GC-rich sequence DNA-binding factor, partial [Cichlidogyrus casuarinus]